MSDDAVAQFMAITSAEAETAHQYLQAADFNLEQAIELFFASGGASADSQTNPGGSGAGSSTDGFDDDVRDRIEGFDDQLVDEEAQMYNEAIRSMRRNEAQRRRPRGIFNQNRDEDLDDHAMSKHEKRLANLFRPPFDIISDLSLDEAKELAQKQGKLVMVNVQDLGEFACQRLNRDIWRSQQVKGVISSNFVFLQYDADFPDGEDYRVLYPFESFPHIAIIDPWTGEQQKTWTKVPGHDEFIEDIYDFISANPTAQIPEEQSEPVASDTAEGSGTNESSGTTAAISRDTSVANSASNSASSSVAQSTHAQSWTPDEGASSSVQSEPAEQPLTPAETEPSEDPVLSIPPNDSPEPPPGPETTRIQLRFSNGKRLVRRFNLTDKVSVIYGIVKHDSGVNTLDLSSERRYLKSELDKTIEEANLKNSTVLVEFE